MFTFSDSTPGGHHDGQVLQSTEIYDIDTDTMINGPDLPKKSMYSCGTKSQMTNQIYIVGGAPSWTDTQIIDVSKRTFSLLPDQLAEGRVVGACMILEEEGLLIAAGGANSTWKQIDTMEILDIKVGRWYSASALPVIGTVWATDVFLLTWLAPKMYQYEPKRDRWLEIEDPPLPLGVLPIDLVEIEAGANKFCQFK